MPAYHTALSLFVLAAVTAPAWELVGQSDTDSFYIQKSDLYDGDAHLWVREEGKADSAIRLPDLG